MSHDPTDLLRTIRRIARDTIEDEGAPRTTRYAKISSSYDGNGNPRLRFDGEGADTLKQYPHLNSYVPKAGDRVMLARGSRSDDWVILGEVGSGFHTHQTFDHRVSFTNDNFTQHVEIIRSDQPVRITQGTADDLYFTWEAASEYSTGSRMMFSPDGRITHDNLKLVSSSIIDSSNLKAPFIRAGDGSNEVNLLEIKTERPWAFVGHGSGAGTKTGLQTLAGGKVFVFWNYSASIGIVMDPGNARITTESGSFWIESKSQVLSTTIRDTTTGGGANGYVSSTSGALARSTSSRRYKRDIENADVDIVTSILNQLRPVWHRSIATLDDPDHSFWGLIAEEVAEVDKRLVHFGEDGKPEGVMYDRIAVLLLAERNAKLTKKEHTAHAE